MYLLAGVTEEVDADLKGVVTSTIGKVSEKIADLRVADAMTEIFNLFKRCNKYIDETTPWILAKDENSLDRLKTVLYNLTESIRVCAVYLQAFLPDTATKIFGFINTKETSYESTEKFGKYESGTKLNESEILFQRIEQEK